MFSRVKPPKVLAQIIRESVAACETSARILRGMRELAEQWNAMHPKGTRVSVTLRNGETLSAETATHAQQWGDLALLTLAGVEGKWSIAALRVDAGNAA